MPAAPFSSLGENSCHKNFLFEKWSLPLDFSVWPVSLLPVPPNSGSSIPGGRRLLRSFNSQKATGEISLLLLMLSHKGKNFSYLRMVGDRINLILSFFEPAWNFCNENGDDVISIPEFKSCGKRISEYLGTSNSGFDQGAGIVAKVWFSSSLLLFTRHLVLVLCRSRQKRRSFLGRVAIRSICFCCDRLSCRFGSFWCWWKWTDGQRCKLPNIFFFWCSFGLSALQLLLWYHLC